MKQIGKVTHYYSKLGVAIIELADELKAGDRIRIERGGKSFDENVSSMQKEYKDIERAIAGDSVGVKVKEKAHEGAVVYLLEEGE